MSKHLGRYTMSNKTKIMIVDDNKEFVKLLTMFIDSQDDMEVIDTLYDGQNAKNKIKELQPDILLLDIIMPEKDGLGVLEDIEKDSELKMPLTIVMSAIGQEKLHKKRFL